MWNEVDAPPAPRRGRRGWIIDCVQRLQQAEGRWFDVATYVQPASAYGAARRLRAAGCESRAHLDETDWLYHVYASWPS